MSFYEKSAWLMSIALTVCGFVYFRNVYVYSMEAGELIAPSLPLLSLFTIGVVIFAVIGHILIALISPKEAEADLDEREKSIFDKAGSLSSYVLGFGAIVGLLHFMVLQDGNVLFYIVFASLLLSHICEYVLQILYYRGRV